NNAHPSRKNPRQLKLAKAPKGKAKRSAKYKTQQYRAYNCSKGYRRLHTEKTRAKLFQKRSSQTYNSLSGTVGAVVAKKLQKRYTVLGGKTMREYMELVGPAQFCITFGKSESAIGMEAFGMFIVKARTLPALMKNPVGHNVKGHEIPQADAAALGLERFTMPEMKRDGWKYLKIMEVDLSKKPDVRAGFALEQQFQFQTMDLQLGYQRCNRVAGAAGNWNIQPSSKIATIMFTYAPPGFKDRIGEDVAVVKSMGTHVPPNSFNRILNDVRIAASALSSDSESSESESKSDSESWESDSESSDSDSDI
ncbi:MAG: hypothetical protein SGARI_007649, partial [Bacillariaceae sp.]